MPRRWSSSTMRLRIVSAVALDEIGLAPRAAGTSAELRNRVARSQLLSPANLIVAAHASTNFNNWVMSCRLALVSTAVSGIPRASVRIWCFDPALRRSVGSVHFLPPRKRPDGDAVDDGAGQIQLASLAQLGQQHGISRRHTTARCQRTSRRQHVLPDPHPISLGSICHGIPLRKMNRIPVNAARSGTRGLAHGFPPAARRLRLQGSIRVQKASSIRRWDMRDRLALGHATVPIRPDKTRDTLVTFEMRS
jgi:hypothetical protein